MPGRGGAGNYEAAAAAQKAAKEKTPRDLEAQAGPPTIRDNSTTAKELPQYSHLGRGGAGNYYSPQELERTGRFDDSSATAKASAAQSGRAAAPIKLGRGGAGNLEEIITSNDKDNQEKHKAMKAQMEDVSRRIAEDVEMGLPRPEKAKLPGAAP